MKNTTLYIFFTLLMSWSSFGQIVINELDADTPSTDNLEFIELKSSTPNMSLDGYVLVFFNGATNGLSNISYYAIDLDTYSTDINGIIHFGNAQVSPTPAIIFPSATLQNGPDAVALYLGNATDFPTGTVAHSNGLIHSLGYTNSTTVCPTALMTALNTTTCIYENQTTTVSKSIQRKNDGSYELATPTPGANNDGSGVVLNYISTSVNGNIVNEGDNLVVTFTTTSNVTQNTTLDFTITNGNFTTSDYLGSCTATITAGTNSASATINVVNDLVNDGDKELKIVISNIPTGFSLYNNNIIIRVLDVNYLVSNFGTPANPTYGNVTPTIPNGYYDSLNGLSGNALKQAIQNIIANPSQVRAHSYGDVWEILKNADQNPANNNQVWLIYTEEPRSKLDQQTGNSIIGKWNREHIFCQSRGNYGDLYNTSADGINVWQASNANDIGAGLTDAHHMRAVDGQENSSRNNRNYGVDYNGPSTTVNSWKGDVARAIFYMAIRYNGLSVVNGNPAENIGQIGDLSTLLNWNTLDPRDDFEMNRNNYIYTWQHNRNPFIDLPNLADYIWGIHFGDIWNNSLATNQINGLDKEAFFVYPNPSGNFITVNNCDLISKIEMVNTVGQIVKSVETNICTSISVDDLKAGIYLLNIYSQKNQSIARIKFIKQ